MKEEALVATGKNYADLSSGGSEVKVSASNAGDLGSIPWSGRAHCWYLITQVIVTRSSQFLKPDIAFYLEKAMAPDSSTLAWKIPWTEEPGRLQSMGSLRVGHD